MFWYLPNRFLLWSARWLLSAVLLAVVLRADAAAGTGRDSVTVGTLRAVTIGASVGPTLTRANFNRGFPRPAVPTSSAWTVGLTAGLWLQVALGGRWSFRQSYLYAEAGGAPADPGTRYQFRYLSLPAQLQYQLLPRLSVAAGPRFDLLLSARQSVPDAVITHDTEERHFGAMLSVMAQISRRFGAGLHYVHGLSHVGLGQRSAVREFKHEWVSLTGEYRF
jgi:hypothetical protein